jgi:putative nucleotidyltransferase with HDIG domain
VDFQTLSIKIARSENLPVLPTVVLRILQLYNDPNISAKGLEQLIQQDAALSAKVLRVASSSLYGSSCESIARAITLMGMNQIRQLAVTLAYQQFMTTKAFVPSFDRMIFWQHCKASSIAARELMARVSPIKSDEAILAGLLHDIGILAMERFAPLELDQAIRNATQKSIPLAQSERETIGFDHLQIGEVIAEKWKLPNSLKTAIRYHDDPFQVSKDAEFALITSAANSLAYELGYPSLFCVPPEREDRSVIDSLGIPSQTIDRILEVIKIEVDVADQDLGSRRAS